MTETLTISLQPIVSPHDAETLWYKNAAAPSGSFFTSWTWLGTWLELLPDTSSVRLLTVARGNERGFALLVPRQVRRHGVLKINQFHINSTGIPDLDCIFIEHNGLAGLNADPKLWAAVERWFIKHCADADELVIPGMEGFGNAAFAAALEERRDAQAFRVSLTAMREQGSVEAVLSRNSRQQLRRAMRRYDSVGPLSLTVAPDVEEALSYFDALKALHVRSWNRRGKPHAFRYPFFEQFHRTLIARGVAQGCVRLISVTAGGRPIGYLYNFRHGDTEYAYQSGFDDEDPNLRPGYVCHAMAIEAAASTGASTYDFLAGSNRLKQSFASETYVMSWTTLRKPTASLRAAGAFRAAARSLKRRLPV